MPNELQELTLREVSLVDAPANSSTDDNGNRNPHARVALWKRDSSSDVGIDDEELMKAVDGKTYAGKAFPASDFAYTPDKSKPSTWKLRLTKVPGGKPDTGIVGAAVAALGKGFRGKQVQIPDDDKPAVIARVRSAWKQANPDKSPDELPNILKGDQNEMALTLADIEKKQGELETLVNTLKADNDFLKKENDVVTKMSKKERKAYAAMSPDEQKAYMAADTEKRKTMCDTAMKARKEKKLEDSLDEATKAEFAKAGPTRRAAILEEQANKIAKAKKVKDAADGDDEDENGKGGKGGEGDDEDNQDEETLKLRKSIHVLTDRVVKTDAQLLELQKKDRLSHFTSIAKSDLSHTSGTDVEKGAMLMELAERCGGENTELYKSYVANLVNADKAMTSNFREIGKSGAGGSFQAEKALDTLTADIMKRDSIDKPHAMEKAMMEHPEIYQEYEQQQRAFASIR